MTQSVGIFTLALVMAGITSRPSLAAPARPIETIALPIEEAADELAPNQFVWQDTDTGEPVSIVISLSTQRAFVYRGQDLIAVTAISSGRGDKATPIGTYPILQKNAAHRSNIYDSAPMPFMQRLTWDGIAIHAGRNPGFPASHGCVRVPTAFAKKLFAVTSLGSVVTVAVDFEGGPPPVYVPPVDTETASANAAQLASIDR